MSDYDTRPLLSREEEIIKQLYARSRDLPPAYVTAARPIPMGSKDGKGPWGGKPDRMIPVGSTLRIVMVSRMGDCGLSDNLDATHGYDVRFNWESAFMSDIRLTKEIEPGSV
jgi:hypothetical protein